MVLILCTPFPGLLFNSLELSCQFFQHTQAYINRDTSQAFSRTRVISKYNVKIPEGGVNACRGVRHENNSVWLCCYNIGDLVTRFGGQILYSTRWNKLRLASIPGWFPQGIVWGLSPYEPVREKISIFLRKEGHAPIFHIPLLRSTYSGSKVQKPSKN